MVLQCSATWVTQLSVQRLMDSNINNFIKRNSYGTTTSARLPVISKMCSGDRSKKQKVKVYLWLRYPLFPKLFMFRKLSQQNLKAISILDSRWKKMNLTINSAYDPKNHLKPVVKFCIEAQNHLKPIVRFCIGPQKPFEAYCQFCTAIQEEHISVEAIL